MNLSPDTLTLLVAVLAVGIGLATLIMRSTSRLDADRHEAQQRFDADRHEAQQRFDADRHETQRRFDADRHETQRRFDTAMETFRAEMQRLAERQSHVEGRVEERSTASD